MISRSLRSFIWLWLALGLTGACGPALGKPSVALHTPPHGSEFRAGENIVVQSSARDSLGIARVELLVDGSVVRVDAAPNTPALFSVAQSWQATPGAHTLTVRAYNIAGIASDPAAIAVSILPAVTPLAAATTAPASPHAPTRAPISTATRPPTRIPATHPPTRVPATALPTPQRLREQTRYEGIQEYSCDPRGCWRMDGSVTAQFDYFFPNRDADNAEIQKLLGSIGAPTTPTTDAAEKWRRIRSVWAWLNKNALPLGHPNQAALWEYLDALMKTPKDHWPSIGDLAKVYDRYGVLVWGACNSRAFTFATLLYRVRLDPDELSVAIAQWKPEYSQHLYVVLRINQRWYYLDPTCSESHPTLSESPENVGCNNADYAHPNTLNLLPSSTITKPMLAR